MDVSDAARSSPPPPPSIAGSEVHVRHNDPHRDDVDKSTTGLDAGSTSPDLPALARFEFQAGKGNEGTKILMVEWTPSPVPTDASISSLSTSPVSRTWQISWEGKMNHSPVDDKDMGPTKRVYFLLSPGATVPASITITHPDGAVLVTKPLPAIFPPGLGADDSHIGTRGILHTIWAKKRLSDLQNEIDAEMRTNSESIGLEMALQERQWIAEHFGIVVRIALGTGVSAPCSASVSQALPSPISPTSSVGGRLGQKLKGLKLATSAADLVAGSASEDTLHHPISFSSTPSGVAVSSFSNLVWQPSARPGRDVSASLNAILSSSKSYLKSQDRDQEDDLFALPMSPRSPEMERSPFSLS